MNNKIKKIFAKVLAIICFITMLVGCNVEATPSVHIGFKITDSAAEYQESIDAFEIGKTFYTCIKVKIVTDKKSAHNFKVTVEVPKTNNIEVDQTGGLEADSNVYDYENQLSKLDFTIKGSKEAVEEKILFKGTPIGEGDARISVSIYNEDGEKVHGSFRIVEFKYELQ